MVILVRILGAVVVQEPDCLTESRTTRVEFDWNDARVQQTSFSNVEPSQLSSSLTPLTPFLYYLLFLVYLLY
jgi:hypothetical protein